MAKRDVAAVRNALWKEVNKAFNDIKKDFLNGETGIKAIDSLDKAVRAKGVAVVARGMGAKLALAEREPKAKTAKPKAAKPAKVKAAPSKPKLPRAAAIAKTAAETVLNPTP